MARVDIYRMNAVRSLEKIIQRVAPGTGDHDHLTVLIQFQKFGVNSRVFPAGIVDESVAVNLFKNKVMNGFEKFWHIVEVRGSGLKVEGSGLGITGYGLNVLKIGLLIPQSSNA